MNFFKKYKILLIFVIIIAGLLIMWTTSIVTKKDIIGSLRDSVMGLIGKKDAAAPSGKIVFGKKETGGEALETTTLIPVKAAKAIKTDYKDVITSFGTIKGFGEIPIRFKESGRVSKFYFKEGDEIKEGDIVVSQDHEEEKIKFEYAQIEYSKNKQLHELGAITADRLRQAELELEKAELDIRKRNFYAPSDGFMGTRKVNESELADPSDVVATFLDISKVFCEVGIIEKDIGKVKVGQDVDVALETFAGGIYEGTVDSVSPMVEGRSRTQSVRILISNEKNLIKPGMFGRAEIVTFESKDAIVIPREALKKTEDGYVVFGIVRGKEPSISPAGFEEAVAKSIPVEVKASSEKLALIAKGLTEGQEIVVESPKGKASIEDGARIEIIEGDVSP